jgi:ABC-type branched-subunit amino acid transport system ATPase component
VPISSAERPEPSLVVKGLVAGYGGAPIVHGVDVSVGPGEIVSIVGPNGAGKSTLLKAIMGQVDVLDGSVALDGTPVTGFSGEQLARRGIGFVPQAKDVFATLTVVENLEMGGYLVPRKRVGARMDEVLDIFPALGTMRTRTASKLSGGERKMLAIARVLMLQPRLIVLDEPTSNLSPALAREVLEGQVKALADTGSAILLVEQKAKEALEIAHWAYVLVAGLVQLSEPAPDLLAREDIGELFLGRAPVGDAR